MSNAAHQPNVEISPIRPNRSRSAKVDTHKKTGIKSKSFLLLSKGDTNIHNLKILRLNERLQELKEKATMPSKTF